MHNGDTLKIKKKGDMFPFSVDCDDARCLLLSQELEKRIKEVEGVGEQLERI